MRVRKERTVFTVSWLDRSPVGLILPLLVVLVSISLARHSARLNSWTTASPLNRGRKHARRVPRTWCPRRFRTRVCRGRRVRPTRACSAVCWEARSSSRTTVTQVNWRISSPGLNTCRFDRPQSTVRWIGEATASVVFLGPSQKGVGEHLVPAVGEGSGARAPRSKAIWLGFLSGTP